MWHPNDILTKLRKSFIVFQKIYNIFVKIHCSLTSVHLVSDDDRCFLIRPQQFWSVSNSVVSSSKIVDWKISPVLITLLSVPKNCRIKIMGVGCFYIFQIFKSLPCQGVAFSLLNAGQSVSIFERMYAIWSIHNNTRLRQKTAMYL